MKKLMSQNRRWLGMTAVVAGSGMVMAHYIDYGFTAHLTLPDHGIAGVILVIIGGLLGAGRPGKRARRPGEEE